MKTAEAQEIQTEAQNNRQLIMKTESVRLTETETETDSDSHRPLLTHAEKLKMCG